MARHTITITILVLFLPATHAAWPPADTQYAAHFSFDSQTVYCGGYNAEHTNWTCSNDNSWGTVNISGITGEYIDNSGTSGIGAIYTTNMPKFNFSNPSAQIARSNGTKLEFYHWTIVVCQPGGAGFIYDIWPDPTGAPGVTCNKSPVEGNSVFDYLPGICDSSQFRGKIGSQFPYRSVLDDSNIIYTDGSPYGKNYVGMDEQYQTLLIYANLPELPNPSRSLGSIIPRPADQHRTTLSFEASTYYESSWPHPNPDDPPSMNTSYTGSYRATGLETGTIRDLTAMTTLPSSCTRAKELPRNRSLLARWKLNQLR